MTTGRTYIVQKSDNGNRLDFFIARSLACGHRTAKRLAANGRVFVNGKARPAHFKLSEGMEITVIQSAPEPEEALFSPADVPLVAQNEDYAVFFKPGGLHTANVAGGSAASLETLLAGHIPPVILLNRLDRETSGLVAAAFTPKAASRFKLLESEGRVCKKYVALVHGYLDRPLLLRNALNTENRKVTRVLETMAEDAVRFTRITPLPLSSPAENTTLVAASIKRGARHQIRAHLAFAGYPIVGDSLYGDGNSGGYLRLHHARLMIPGFAAFLPPPWLAGFPEKLFEDGPCASGD